MRGHRVWICAALFASAMAVAQAADKPIKKWDEVENSIPDCASMPDWTKAKKCIEDRQRDPFSQPGQHPPALSSSELSARSGRPLSAGEARERNSEQARSTVSESVPLSAPLSPDEQSELGKLQTMRSFESQERLDVQQDLRDLRDLLKSQ